MTSSGTETVERDYVGRGIPRVEDLRFLTGGGHYADDYQTAGQLHVSIVRSEVAHGRLLGVDASTVESMPGVVGVFTAADLPLVHIPIRLLPTKNAERALQPALATDRVRYVGDPVAVVVAEDPYLAEDAAAAIQVNIETLPPVLDPRAAAAEGSELLHPEIGSNLIDVRTAGKRRGLDAAFKKADLVLKRHFTIQRHGAVPLEPRSLLAVYEAENDRLVLTGAAKVKHFNRRILSALLEMPEERLRFIESDVGGGFGARGEFYPEDYLIPWLAKHLGRPVKWTEDRRENLVALNHSREQDWQIEVAAMSDGTLLAFRANGLFNQGGYVRTHGSVLLPMLMQNHLPGPYRWKAYEIETSVTLSNKTPAGTYRGPGQYEPTFVRERMVDMVADRLGLDPVEIRRRNLLRPEELPHKTGLKDIDTGRPVVYEEGDFPQTFERLIEAMDYEGLKREVEARRSAGEKVGLAATCFVEMGNPGVFEQSKVEAAPDGTFTAHVGIASVGQGVETVLSQIAADVLDVPMDAITISYKDTDIVPEGQGAFSSRATVWGGQAIAGAIETMIENARSELAAKLEVDAESIKYESGSMVWGDGDDDRATLGDLSAGGEYRYQPGEASHILMGSNIGVIAVDPEAGGVKIERYGISYEVGKVINPLTLEGQVCGAAAQGFGGALLEEFVYSPEGQPLSASFMDYALPSAVEIPPIEVVLLELGEASENNPVAGAKGGGEGGIIATAATVVNGVAQAIGDPEGTLTSLPMTPERVQRLGLRGTS